MLCPEFPKHCRIARSSGIWKVDVLPWFQSPRSSRKLWRCCSGWFQNLPNVRFFLYPPQSSRSLKSNLPALYPLNAQGSQKFQHSSTTATSARRTQLHRCRGILRSLAADCMPGFPTTRDARRKNCTASLSLTHPPGVLVQMRRTDCTT